MKKKEITLIIILLLILLTSCTKQQVGFQSITSNAVMNCISGGDEEYQECVKKYGLCNISKDQGVTLICWQEGIKEIEQQKNII